MRPVDRGEHPVDATGADVAYSEYQRFKRHLTDRLGHFCSYCERRLETHVAVEHIAPKKHHPELEIEWENFLLACTNCNSTKSDKRTVGASYYFPQEVNTAHAFVYDEALVLANPDLTAAEQAIATATLALVGLDQGPRTDPNDPDVRGDRRYIVWQKAASRKRALASCPTDEMRDSIADLASESGFFSIWRTVFADDTGVLRRLLERTVRDAHGVDLSYFPGTRPACFDADGRTVPDLNL